MCLLLTTLKSPNSNLPVNGSEKSSNFLEQPDWYSSPPVKGLALALVVSVVSAAILFPYTSTFMGIGVSFGFLASLMGVYYLVHQESQDSPSVNDDSPLISLPNQSISWRVATVLTLMILVPSNHPAEIDIFLVLFTAILKAVQWVAIFELINKNFLLPLSTITTFATSLSQIATLPTTSGRAELNAAVALVSLAQTYTSMPKFAYSRTLIIMTVTLVFMTLIYRRSEQVHQQWDHKWQSSPDGLHPIEVLVNKANADFNAMVTGQSKTVDEAIVEYKRRYKREPPKGFEEWFDLAVGANCTIIDNFDTIMETLDPFWGISAQEMRARVAEFRQKPMGVVKVENHEVSMPHNTLVLRHFDEILKEWTNRHKKLLPDMEFLVNGLAEPRIFVPHDRLHNMVHNCAPPPEDTSNTTRVPLEVMNLGRQSLWQIGTRSCPEDSPSRSLVQPKQRSGLALPFMSNATEAKDWCAHPEAATSHGLFASPYSFKITDTLLPIFSHGKASSSQDILYPSPDYLASYRDGRYDDSMDIPWEDKDNKFYWKGSDTGAYADGDNWRGFHRQRFVSTVNDGEKTVELLRRDSKGRWQQYKDKMSKLTNLINVHFNVIFACEKETCAEERKILPLGKSEDRKVAYRYRYIFDVDGMGRTERFYRLLMNRATILKQTMHREWHDDRLVPWVHYVPVSLSMKELPETIRFLALTERGQEISKNIAAQGRDWVQKALREKDMDLAFLRLLLEYGRLYNSERDETGYCPDGRIRRD